MIEGAADWEDSKSDVNWTEDAKPNERACRVGRVGRAKGEFRSKKKRDQVAVEGRETTRGGWLTLFFTSTSLAQLGSTQ